MIKKILLIDDSEPDNFLHAYLLKKSGKVQEIVTVLNVEQALDFLKETMGEKVEMPEAILLDINMPRLNGWEFLDIILKSEEFKGVQTKVYMLTTSLNPDDENKALNVYKLDGYLNKPLTLDHINQIIDELDREN